MTDRRVICALAILCGSCGGQHADDPGTASRVGVAGCIDITASPYGATPDNAADDDGPAIQRAIAAAVAPGGPHVVCVPAGEFDVKRPASGQYSINISATHDLDIVGAGEGSVIAQYEPSATHCATLGAANWHLFNVYNDVTRLRFRDLSLTAIGIDEYHQNTLLRIGDGASAAVTDVSVENVSLTNSCGDDIYLIGSPSGVSSDVRIVNSRIETARRRGVTIKHGVQRLSVVDSTFDGNNGALDVDVKDETGGDDPQQLVIADNLFVNDAAETIPHLQLNGQDPGNPLHDVVIRSNVFLGGGIEGTNMRGATIAANTVLGASGSATTQDVDLSFYIEEVQLTGNVIVRTSSNSAAPAINVYASHSVRPVSVMLSDNTVVVPSGSQIVRLWGVQHQTISRNLLVQLVPPSTASGIMIGSDVDTSIAGTRYDIADARIDHNVILGSIDVPLARAIDVWADHTSVFGQLAITGNVVHGASAGVKFTRHAGAGFAYYPLITDNVLDVTAGKEVDSLASLTCSADCGQPPPLAEAYLVGGNRGGPIRAVGDGEPTGLAAPDGSIYLRRDGGASTTLYVHEGGAWVAK